MTNKLPRMAMDNFEVKVVAKGMAALDRAIELALCGQADVRAFAETKIDGVNTLLLQWYVVDATKQTRFPTALDLEQLVPIVWKWLADQDYGKEPDIDGHCTMGWKLLTQYPYKQGEPSNLDWTYVVFAVQPEWAEHHK